MGRRRWSANQPRVAVLYEDNFNYLSKMCLLRMREAAFAMIGMARAARLHGHRRRRRRHRPRRRAYLDAGADYVLIGEGEETLGELLDHLLARRASTPLETILGLAYRDATASSSVNAAPARPERPRRAAVPGLGPGRHRRATGPSGWSTTATTR